MARLEYLDFLSSKDGIIKGNRIWGNKISWSIRSRLVNYI